MRFNCLKPQNWLFAILIAFFAMGSKAWAIPQENILLIYYADSTTQTCATGTGAASTYPQQLEADFATALAPPLSASVQTLLIHNGDLGITSELTAQYPGETLANWCQVYDLRFLNNCDNTGWSAGQNTADLVTNADMVLYQNYLAQGGSLFLQGEHHDFFTRNNNLIQLINTMAASPIISAICGTDICPAVSPGSPPSYQWTNCFTANYGFNTNDNNLSNPTSMVGWYVGGIPAGDYGSGLPLITIPSLPDGGTGGTTGATMMAWEGGALNAPYSAGKLVASFETNAYAEAVMGDGVLQSVYANQALQNVYTLLTGCLHYTVTKTFNQSPLTVGQSSFFTICANNTSTLSTINNYSISDTIATCLTYNSSTTSVATSGTGNQSAGAAGTLYWWTFGTIAPGASACVTVNFTAANTTCP